MDKKKKRAHSGEAAQKTPRELETKAEQEQHEAEPAGDATSSGSKMIVVGIGASAGGIEAMSQLLESLPERTGMAWVFVQHLAAHKTSMLPSVLHPKTGVPVIQAQDGMIVEPDHLYVIPPDARLEIIDGKLRLSERPEHHTPFLPIDCFFRSLAQYAGNRAIGVVLSGNGADGSVGLREIKGAGGITFAQQPETARYDSMPRMAVATGIVDLVLPPPEIAMELA